MFTDLKNNRFQKKLIMQNTNEYMNIGPPNYRSSYATVDTPHNFFIAKLSIRKSGSDEILLALMKIRAYGSKALQ